MNTVLKNIIELLKVNIFYFTLKPLSCLRHLTIDRVNETSDGY